MMNIPISQQQGRTASFCSKTSKPGLTASMGGGNLATSRGKLRGAHSRSHVGGEKIRHLQSKLLANGSSAFYWNPSKTVRALGMAPEALGTNGAAAAKRALELNALADELRVGRKSGDNGPTPGTIARLFRDFRKSLEFADLKPRTRKDYGYYLDKIEGEFGALPVSAMSARVVKEYYRRLVREQSVTWAYHVVGTLRAALSWAVTEDWIPQNPALDVTIKSPPKRRVMWEPSETEAYIAKAHELGWHSVATMARVFDCIGQSPIDVRPLKRRAYDGRTIAVTREKTGVSDAPIPLWEDVRAELDSYLATRPTLHPDAPLFANERTGEEWKSSTLNKVHVVIRRAAGLRAVLQMQDFRRTAQTEAGAAGATADELRALARHATRTAALHYVHPDRRFVDAAQSKRLAGRNKKSAKSQNAD